LKEARLRFEHSLSISPNQPLAPLVHKEFGDLLSGTGDYAAAVSHYEVALKLQPDFVEARENLDFARTLVER
jgi:tetratricopeptide (TPR) repeat protein